MNTDQILYYSQRAQEYEKIYTLPERQKNISEIKKFLKQSFFKKEVFEIACGTGYWTKYISETANLILSTDINESVLDIAKSNEYSCPVKVQKADTFDLSNISQTFNAGFAGFIWSHILKQELTEFINQFLSKINKDGLIIFIDNIYVEGNSTPLIEPDEHRNTYQKRKLENEECYTVVKNYPTDSEMVDLIGTVGKNINIKRLDYYWILSCNKK